MRVHFLRTLIVGFLNTRYDAGLDNVSFLNQFIDAFQIGLLGPGQTFQVSGLPTRNCALSAPGRLQPLSTTSRSLLLAGRPGFGRGLLLRLLQSFEMHALL